MEIINDLNRFVINFYEQAKHNFHNVQAKIRATPHSRGLYRDAMVMYDNPHLFDDLERAWAFWVLTNQGYSGKIGAWGFATADNRCEKTLNVKRETFLPEIRERLDVVQLECADALRVIEVRDRPETFFYCDPPYHNSNMGHYSGYTAEDFEQLLQALSKIQGKFLLSSFPSDLLTRYTEQFGWHQIKTELPTMASKARKPKTEVLTANYSLKLF